MSRKVETITFRVKPEVKASLEEYCEKKDMTISFAMNRLVHILLKADEQEQKGDEEEIPLMDIPQIPNAPGIYQ
jgi:hypothetical protein